MGLVLFILAFGVGPALFMGLARYDRPNWPVFVLACGLVLAGFFLRSSFGAMLAPPPVPILLSVAVVWLAWVLVLVLLARALRTAYRTPRAHRIIRGLCAMGTTVPWFGFATARMMGGT